MRDGLKTLTGSLVGALLALVAAAASAQTPAADPLWRGYQLLYGGDISGATRQFESLLTAKPDDLPARFAWLIAARGRMEITKADQPAFERNLDALIDLADARYSRTTRDTEALFYLASGHMLRSEYRFNNDKGLWGAARDAATAKGDIETYLKQYPQHGDAYFVLGLYNYYVDIAPTFVKFLRVLLFLPAGNRAEGLKQLERTAREGTLFGPQAKVVLVDIYATFEARIADAEALAAELRREFPASDFVDAAVARMYASAEVEDHARAAEAYEAIVARHQHDETPDGAIIHYRALLNLAAQRVADWRIDDAIAVLTPVIDAGVATPDWVLPQYLLRRANYRELKNDPHARDDLKRILGDSRMASFYAAANSVLTSIQSREASGEAERYARLIPANRLVALGRYDDARRAYGAVQPQAPQDPLLRYRLALLDFLTGSAERAIPVFTAIAADRGAPANIRALALLYVARAHDLAGRRDQARRTYQKVLDEYKKQSAAGMAKVGLITPYRVRGPSGPPGPPGP